MKIPATQTHAKGILKLLQATPDMMTSEICEALKIDAVQFANAYRRISSLCHREIVSQRVYRYSLIGMIPTELRREMVQEATHSNAHRALSRECVPMHLLPAYSGEKPTHRVSL